MLGGGARASKGPPAGPGARAVAGTALGAAPLHPLPEEAATRTEAVAALGTSYRALAGMLTAGLAGTGQVKAFSPTPSTSSATA